MPFLGRAAGATTARAACAPRSGAPSLVASGERITITTRRLALRPSEVVLLLTGRYSPSPITASLPGSMSRLENRCTTLLARAAGGSQLEGNASVLIGRSSVWPSTRIGFGTERSDSARRVRISIAVGARVALPLGNRMSVRISTSTEDSPRRTATRFFATRSCIAFVTLCATRSKAAAARRACSALLALCTSVCAGSPASCALTLDWVAAAARGGVAVVIGRLTAPGAAAPLVPAALLAGGGGLFAVDAPLNADTMASESTRYLPSFTEEIAYITTKNASSRVIRSA